MEDLEQKKQTNTRSYRVDDTTAERIAALARELGVNQNGVFEALLSAYELQQDAALVPDAAKDIETFVSYLRNIQDAYHNLVSINTQTEERVRQEFKRRLENSDQQISDLLEQSKSQKSDLQNLRDEMVALTKDLEIKNNAVKDAEQKLTERDQALSDKQTIIDSLTARLPEQTEVEQKIKIMEDQIAELRASLSAAEIARADAVASADKTAAELELTRQQAKHEEEAHQQALDTVSRQATAELEMVKQQAEMDKKAHQQEMETVNKQAAADLKAAVADARQEERDRAQVRADQMQNKIDELRSKLDEQKDIILELRANAQPIKSK